MWNKPVPPRILDAARQLKQRGLVRFLAVSTHERKLVPQIAAANDFDIVHFRYNAAHPGAEKDIFPAPARHTVPAWFRLPPRVGGNCSARRRCKGSSWARIRSQG